MLVINYCILHTGVTKEQAMFNSSMSEEEFFKWLKSRGISDKDCKTLSGKCASVTEYLNIAIT